MSLLREKVLCVCTAHPPFLPRALKSPTLTPPRVITLGAARWIAVLRNIPDFKHVESQGSHTAHTRHTHDVHHAHTYTHTYIYARLHTYTRVAKSGPYDVYVRAYIGKTKSLSSLSSCVTRAFGRKENFAKRATPGSSGLGGDGDGTERWHVATNYALDRGRPDRGGGVGPARGLPGDCPAPTPLRQWSQAVWRHLPLDQPAADQDVQRWVLCMTTGDLIFCFFFSVLKKINE